MKPIGTFFALLTLLFVQTAPLIAQIPASELPPPGTDTGLDGKYDPQNGIAQLVRGEGSGEAKIFEDDRVLVFMPRGRSRRAGPCPGCSETVGREKSVGFQA